MKTTLAILTLNEIIGLKEIFKLIPLDAVDEVFAIDGGSTDGTLEFFKENNIVTHIQNKKGRGEAFRLAFEKSNSEAVIFFSPDGNEDPNDISKFSILLDKGADIVIGNRMSDGGHNEEDDQIFKIRKWANNFFTLIANLTWNRGVYIRDTINGFRAIRKSSWQALAPDGPGYTIEYQTSIRAMKQKLAVAEFPTNESLRIDGREGSPGISTGLQMFKIYFRELRIG